MNYVKTKLEDIENSKKNKNLEPHHTLFNELMDSIQLDIKKTLNNMYKNKEIKVGRTVNQQYIKIIE